MLNGRGEKSAFDRGVSSVSMLLVRLMLVMTPAVFAINAATKGNVIDALLFAASVAVGITPQMLPVIVTTSLSQGAKDLARRQVIVKELPAIQNLGAMDVLCCDKTGTLTEDRIVLERYLNTDGNEDARVLRHAFLNSFFQTGLKNLIDLAVIDRADVTPSSVAPDSMLGQSLRDRYIKVDEVPFDFSRRRLSVVVADARAKPRWSPRELPRKCSRSAPLSRSTAPPSRSPKISSPRFASRSPAQRRGPARDCRGAEDQSALRGRIWHRRRVRHGADGLFGLPRSAQSKCHGAVATLEAKASPLRS